MSAIALSQMLVSRLIIRASQRELPLRNVAPAAK
jgi:hypothetical protein